LTQAAQTLSGFDSVLVTGASGWLGRRLVGALARGLPDDDRFAAARARRIRCLIPPGQDASELGSLGPVVEVCVGDLRDPAACQAFCADSSGSVLLHTAGIIHPRRVREFYEVNVEGSRNVLAAAVEAQVRRAVVVSSNSPCGCNPRRDHRFDERSPYHPYMNYGRSKMMMEQIVGSLQAAGRIETVVLRPPWFYGPDQPPRQTLFFDMIRRGKAPIVGEGQNPRSMCYIDNLCQGLLLAATAAEANGQTYWIADARAYTMNEIVDSVERLLEEEFGVGCAHRRLRLPKLASQAAWLADSALQAVGLYHSKIHVLGELDKTIACTIDKAVTELGYVPRVELVEGMRRSLRWLKDTQPHLPLWQPKA
jgi:nucleoside-diphosphate-sugar epimerase